MSFYYYFFCIKVLNTYIMCIAAKCAYIRINKVVKDAVLR